MGRKRERPCSKIRRRRRLVVVEEKPRRPTIRGSGGRRAQGETEPDQETRGRPPAASSHIVIGTSFHGIIHDSPDNHRIGYSVEQIYTCKSFEALILIVVTVKTATWREQIHQFIHTQRPRLAPRLSG